MNTGHTLHKQKAVAVLRYINNFSEVIRYFQGYPKAHYPPHFFQIFCTHSPSPTTTIRTDSKHFHHFLTTTNNASVFAALNKNSIMTGFSRKSVVHLLRTLQFTTSTVCEVPLELVVGFHSDLPMWAPFSQGHQLLNKSLQSLLMKTDNRIKAVIRRDLFYVVFSHSDE